MNSPVLLARRWPAEPALVATSDPRALLRYLHDEVKLSYRELEKVTGVHRVTLSRWRSDTSKGDPRDVGRLDDLRVIVALMVNSGAFAPEETGRFLRSRDESLDHRPPLALLANSDDPEQTEREFRRVLAVTQALVDRCSPEIEIEYSEAATGLNEPRPRSSRQSNGARFKGTARGRAPAAQTPRPTRN